jgi:hypothetical protein
VSSSELVRAAARELVKAAHSREATLTGPDGLLSVIVTTSRCGGFSTGCVRERELLSSHPCTDPGMSFPWQA